MLFLKRLKRYSLYRGLPPSPYPWNMLADTCEGTRLLAYWQNAPDQNLG
jgi:hypothetical protein